MQLQKSPVLLLFPVVGIGLFLVLYVLAAQYYPGGSQADKLAVGFSWMHNYWCNLLNETAVNNQPNPARPIALLAMAILSASLVVFWYQLPTLFSLKRPAANLIRLPGMLSMFFALFIFTELHDIVVNLAALFGFVALAGTFIGLYKGRSIRLLALGVICLLLIALNNYFYFATNQLYYLPVTQKITFLVVLGWMSCLTIAMYNQRKRTQSGQASAAICSSFTN